MKKNKKGFSLIELVVAVAILVVIAGVLVPSMVASSKSLKEKTDTAAIQNLGYVVTSGTQTSAIFKTAKTAAELDQNKTIYVYYVVDGTEKSVKYSHCEIDIHGIGVIDDKMVNSYNATLITYGDLIENYVNGVMETIVLQSDKYNDKTFKIKLQFTDLDFKVHYTMDII